MKLVLLAGGLTLSNEWLQTNSINWRVPVATVLAAVAVNAVGQISPNGATSLGLLALIVAAATPLNGKSPIQQINTTVNKPRTPKKKVTGVFT
jgi:hypothetical protein